MSLLKKSAVDRLIEAAVSARVRAYCPYSRYPVGAAVLTEEGRVFTGCNVENASYGLTICAERVAVFQAVVAGPALIRAVAVVGTKANPCGACRQVLLEFSDMRTKAFIVDLDASSGRRVTRTLVSRLLPLSFDARSAGLLPSRPAKLSPRSPR